MQHTSSRAGLTLMRAFALSVTRNGILLTLTALTALTALMALSGCSVIGGVAGYAKDDRESLTKIVPVAEAAGIRKGATVYLTIPNRDTMKGRFASLTEKEDRKYINLRTPDGEMRIGLADVTEIAVDFRDNDKLIKGLLIGGAVDALLIGGTFWMVQEINSRQTF